MLGLKENELKVAVGRKGRGKGWLWSLGWTVRIAKLKMDNQLGTSTQHRELHLFLWQPGWEEFGGGNGYVHMYG